MSVNGVTNVYGTDTYQSYAKTKTAEKAVETTETTQTAEKENNGVVYEASDKTEKPKKYVPDANMIAKLKADADARTAQLRNLVEQMMGKQGKTIGLADDMWKFLASGDYTVDPATKAQAQADIAEDGYWGVKQTSDRIIDFATALTGGDPAKIEEMREAFIKGYKMATKTWGQKLPDISQRTYDAVMEKFDKLAAQAAGETEA